MNLSHTGFTNMIGQRGSVSANYIPRNQTTDELNDEFLN